MQEVIWSSWDFENAHAHPQWRKDPHLLRMQDVIWSNRTFEGTHEHPQQRKSIPFLENTTLHHLANNPKTKANTPYNTEQFIFGGTAGGIKLLLAV